MKKYVIIIAILISTTRIFAQRKDYLVTLTTSKGVAHMVLYDETPLHKANFLNHVKEQYYDSLLFHRVIEKFMIQGGDPNSKNAKPGARLGSGGGNMEKIPYEFTPLRVHKKGALAAASNGNPEKMSNPVQFYIVQGRKHSDEEVSKVEKTNDIKYTNKQRADYMTIGGYPSLDNRYTVFGEVVDNLKLIDDIAVVQKDEFNRPVEDIKMAMTMKKMRKKKITRLYGYKFVK
ncbi:peptidylprolyl isomerase [Lacihabitans sp. LS3-19]|uniref:peptidylprolyl isomerase n=2 Tax=Lacihabitans sp. LS3-19 TaxID=2487335 RepID=UPI0020CCEEFC|nr:peptidylprolyl isomerase [Lacihabitans sp. LS3-19]MCP9769120.1 peptidylprolyl isomerase [Lacihabitans sp. LS3-19]